jgi:small-conductance mechanosensitive channel
VDITIPNSLVLANHIINFSSSAQSHGLILNTKVTIGYDVDWRKVHELLLAAAKRVEALMPEPAPFVLQTSLDDFYVSYELNAYTKVPAKMAVTYSQLHAEIQNAFAEAGVEIMSPHYTAARDGNAAAIPAEHLPRDYTVPAFNIFARMQRGPAPKT